MGAMRAMMSKKKAAYSVNEIGHLTGMGRTKVSEEIGEKGTSERLRKHVNAGPQFRLADPKLAAPRTSPPAHALSAGEDHAKAHKDPSVAGFCHRYGIGRTKFYDEIKTGRLRAVKIGARTIVTADDEARWLASLPEVGASRRRSV
jgi:hypothetical protein